MKQQLDGVSPEPLKSLRLGFVESYLTRGQQAAWYIFGRRTPAILHESSRTCPCFHRLSIFLLTCSWQALPVLCVCVLMARRQVSFSPLCFFPAVAGGASAYLYSSTVLDKNEQERGARCDASSTPHAGLKVT